MQMTKYRIQATKDGAKLPHEQDFSDCRDDSLIKASVMQGKFPDDVVEIVLQKSFRQKGGLRWRFVAEKNTLEIVSRFDKTQGTTNFLTAEAQ